jgi:lipoprotein-anchoring transpeptidase ErfK/SrfK
MRILVALVGVAAITVVTACASAGASWRAPTGPPPASAEFTLSHAADATDVSPADPVVVDVTGGTLNTVTLLNPDGAAVAGEYDAARTSWRSTEMLGYDKSYTLTASSTGEDGKVAEETRVFSTVKPSNYTLPYLRANVSNLLDGGTFGVGQPIVVWFDEPIKDKAAAERTLSVTSTPAVEGGWRWFGDREVHWRPKEYWPAGTKVSVEANVYGKNLGEGLYGQESRKASFTIGKSKIAIADEDSKHMKVYIDGKQVTEINGRDVTDGIPISMGKGGTVTGDRGQTISYTTNSGPHVVTTKHEVYQMTSASYGITDPNDPNYYDESIKKSIRISGDGEFVHLADWNISAHGVRNTSHGCINVAPAYIFWFYDTFGAGDIVDVKNTSRQLAVNNGLGDWVLSWEEWQKGSALAP